MATVPNGNDSSSERPTPQSGIENTPQGAPDTSAPQSASTQSVENRPTQAIPTQSVEPTPQSPIQTERVAAPNAAPSPMSSAEKPVPSSVERSAAPAITPSPAAAERTVPETIQPAPQNPAPEQKAKPEGINTRLDNVVIPDNIEKKSPKKEKTASGDKKTRNITAVLITILFLGIISVSIGSGALIGFLVNTYNTLPGPEEMANIKPSLVTRVYDKDSLLIHEFSIERRFWIHFDSIPENMRNAVVAIEDQRYYTHWGIDLKRIMGATVANILSNGYSQGASTLTQQLARNLYFSHEKTLLRKVREILTAIKLEQYYTKEEILELYLNQVYLGAGVYGIEAAAQRYFSKSATELTLNEAAILAGTIQLPEHYRPDRKKNLKRTEVRRNSVLRGMARAGFITPEVEEAGKKEPIKANPAKPGSKQAPYFVEAVRRYLEKEYGEDLLYNGGLNIYTTLDSKAQIEAEKSLAEHLDTLQRFPNRIFLYDNKPWRKTKDANRDLWMEKFDSLYAEHDSLFFDSTGESILHDTLKLRKIQASVLALDNATGAVRVMIGGKDFKTSKYNRALQSVRQPGSAIKPFVYAAALLRGYTPASIVIDKPITLNTSEGVWRPENYEHKFFGPITIREALRHSVNIPAIKVGMDIGINQVTSLCRTMGLEHSLPSVPALAIGACEVTNMELTSAYAAFGNRGLQAKPYFIERVEDRKGRTLEEHEVEVKRVIKQDVADLTNQLMRSVVDNGTAVRVRRYGFYRQAAGKTGTTNKYSDAWFVGYTPQLSCGVWVGVDERRSMGRGVTGAAGSIPVWTSTMKALHEKLPNEKFQLSPTIVKKSVCSETYGLATRYCPKSYEELFIQSRTPKVCTKHTVQEKRDSSNVIDYFGSEKANTVDTPDDDNSSLIF